jgi:hypothetical protein
VIAQSFVEKLRVGTLASGWLYAIALLLRIGIGSALTRFVQNVRRGDADGRRGRADHARHGRRQLARARRSSPGRGRCRSSSSTSSPSQS